MTDKDLQFKANIASQKGELFYQQDLYQDAINSNMEAYRDEEILKDTLNMAYCLNATAYIFSETEQYDSSLIYYKRALRLAVQIKDSNTVNEIKGQMATLYRKKGQYQLAWQYIRPLLYQHDSVMQNLAYYIAANVFMETDKPDSAMHYYRKVVVDGNIFRKRTGYKKLAVLYARQGNTAEALRCIELYEGYEEKISQEKATQTVKRMEAVYNYDKMKEEAEKLKIEKMEAQRLALCILLLLVTGIAIVGFYLERYRHTKRMQKERLAAIRKDADEKARAIQNLEETVDRKEKELQVLHDKIAATEERLKTNEGRLLPQPHTKNLPAGILQDETYIRLQEQALTGLPAHAFNKKAALAMISSYMPQFAERLFAERLHYIDHLSESDFFLCCMIRLGFNNAQIAHVTAISDSGVSKAISRLTGKMLGNSTTRQDLLQYIHDL